MSVGDNVSSDARFCLAATLEIAIVRTPSLPLLFPLFSVLKLIGCFLRSVDIAAIEEWANCCAQRQIIVGMLGSDADPHEEHPGIMDLICLRVSRTTWHFPSYTTFTYQDELERCFTIYSTLTLRHIRPTTPNYLSTIHCQFAAIDSSIVSRGYLSYMIIYW